MQSSHCFHSDMKLMHGDELRLRYVGEIHKPWSGVGHVIKIADSILYEHFSSIRINGRMYDLCPCLMYFSERLC